MQRVEEEGEGEESEGAGGLSSGEELLKDFLSE